jgi:hypothetical protein
VRGSALPIDAKRALTGHYDESVVLQFLEPIGHEVFMGLDHQRSVADRQEDAAVIAGLCVITALERDIEVSGTMGQGSPRGRVHHIEIHLHEQPDFRFALHAALDFAKAMLRERTQLLTSGLGSIGWGTVKREGQSPNFSLYL